MTSDQKKLLVSTLSVFTLAAALATASYFATSPTRTTTHASALTDTIASQTTTLTSKLSSYTSTTNATTKTQLSVDMQSVALSRKNNLLSLLPSDPKSFLSLATLGPTRSSFPLTIQPAIEANVTKQGQLIVIHTDHFIEKTSDTDYVLESPNYSITFLNSTSSLSLTPANRYYSATGILLGSHLALTSTMSPSTITAPQGPLTNPNRLLVILANFRNRIVHPFTKDDIKSAVFTSSDSTRNRWLDSSYYSIDFDGDVVDWVTLDLDLPTDKDDCANQSEIYTANAKVKAGLAGYDTSQFGKFQVFLMDNHICNAGGRGQMSNNDSWAYEINLDQVRAVSAHELGHNKGLAHAGALLCSYPDNYTDCSFEEYADPFDIMDNISNTYYRLNGPHKIALIYHSFTNITSTGTYTFDLFGSALTAKGLRIAKPDTGDAYYLTSRKNIGFDSGILTEMTTGTSIHVWNGSSSGFTKHVYPNNHFALTDNEVFYDSINKIRVTQLSHTSNTITVKVEFQTPPTSPTPGCPGTCVPDGVECLYPIAGSCSSNRTCCGPTGPTPTSPAIPPPTYCGCGASCTGSSTCRPITEGGVGCNSGMACVPNNQLGFVCYSDSQCASGPQCPSNKNTQFYYDYSSSGTATTWYGGDFINSHPPTLPFYLDVNCFKELGAGFTEAGIKLTNKAGQVIASSDTFELRNVRITTSDVYTATCTQRDLSTCYDQDSFTILPPPPYSVEWGGIYGASCSQIVGETVIWTPVPTATAYNVKITNVTTGAVYPANGVTGTLSNGYVLYTFSTPFPVPGNYRASVAAINQYGTSAYANSTTNQNYPACTPTPSPSPTPIQWRAPDGTTCVYGTRSPSYYKYFSLPNCSGTANYHAQGGDCSTTGNGNCYKWSIPSYSAPAASYQTNSNPACTNLSSALNLGEMAPTLTPCSWGPSPTPSPTPYCASCTKIICPAGLVCQCGVCAGSPAQ